MCARRGILLCVAVILINSPLLKAEQKCCKDDVCFTNDPPFEGLPLPSCPESFIVTMTLYTRANPDKGQLVSVTNIPTVYEGSKLTMFVTHGWFGSKDNMWMLDIMDDALRAEDCNVIVVGWASGAMNLRYDQSAADTRTVGGEVGRLAARLVAERGSERGRLYCVGHSLGGHVCGHAGMAFKFGRITGLDPAGPLFETRDPLAGLNPSCADLVDVIHTGGRGAHTLNLGTMKTLGHVDFYPNGGGDQPECVGSPMLPDVLSQFGLDQLIREPIALLHLVQSLRTAATDILPVCGHFTAVRVFKESILTPCFNARHLCTDQNILPVKRLPVTGQDSCTGSMYTAPLQAMGFSANQHAARGIFYLHTNAHAPLCNN